MARTRISAVGDAHRARNVADLRSKSTAGRPYGRPAVNYLSAPVPLTASRFTRDNAGAVRKAVSWLTILISA
jgi:hypothetical protein